MKLFSLLTGDLSGSLSTAARLKKKQASTFGHFVFHTKLNRRLLVIAITGTIMQLIIFKMLYPFPDFISDSYSYIETNIYHMDVNLWPIGYSKFIWLVHMISHSDTVLVAIQYFLLEIALAYFFYTFLYLYRPEKKTSTILYIFFFFNPLFLYLSNCILSDAIFTSLSIVFFTQFLWMFHQPNIKQVIIQGVIIGVAFTIRYTAIYYPLVSIIGFILSHQSIRTKILGSLLGLTLMFIFYRYTQLKTKEITGTAEFSVFEGWQIANNALYMYGHIKVDSNSLPPGTQELDRMVKQFFKKIDPQDKDFATMPGTYFIKVPYAPLKQYLFSHVKEEDFTGGFRSWGIVSPMYNAYGTYLIKNNPFAFARYYLWLNTKNYFLPHLEKFGIYNLGTDSVWPAAQYWFNYKTYKIKVISSNLQGFIFFFFPGFFLLVNLYFVGSLIWICVKIGFQKLDTHFSHAIFLITFLLFINFCFSIFATPIVLRYQIFPMIIFFSFSLLLMEYFERII